MNTICFEQTFSDMSMEIEYRECELAIERAMHETSCILDNYNQLFYMEAGDNNSEDNKCKTGVLGGIANAFKTIISKIRKLLNSITEGIRQSFGDKLDSDEYLSSDSAAIKFSKDVSKMSKDIDVEYANGRRLVRMISKGLKINPVEVEKFVDNSKSIIHKYGPATLRTGVTMGLGLGLKKSLKKMNGLTDEAEQAVSKMNTGDTEEVKKAQKVLHGIFKLAGTVGETINIYLTTKGTQYENMNRADKKRAKKNKK